ncbi:NmrA family transcriptional regulator [Agreia sp. Leaf244]|uniref:NAD(P)-dependent oxidoreductase n=1 Tax=Agreia sp. Leaf244 TaxID=1736305 RepID=UPI0006F48F36|nr:NAD(P)H-binding protein [Agreia sp. Leaf244]KQO11798.1 NmrA family transcriptional regulator [Agreia sp. Leaf244]
METTKPFLVFGATGQTGRHFTRLALEQGHRVRAIARDPSKVTTRHPDLTVMQGSITEDVDLDALASGTDAVVMMIGDAALQRERTVATDFMRRLVPALRRQGVDRLLYQAGGLSAAPGTELALPLRVLRATVARKFIGQHKDNEAVMRYLTDEARDIEWMVHRAGIGSDGPSKGVLHRSSKAVSIAPFRDCAAYNLRTVMDASAVHTCDVSSYRAGSVDQA